MAYDDNNGLVRFIQLSICVASCRIPVWKATKRLKDMPSELENPSAKNMSVSAWDHLNAKVANSMSRMSAYWFWRIPPRMLS